MERCVMFLLSVKYKAMNVILRYLLYKFMNILIPLLIVQYVDVV